MKRATLFVAFGLCIFALAMASPNFSGTWVMNADKSDPVGGGARPGGAGGGMGGGEMVITMTATEMVIARTFGQNAIEIKYILDGAEHTSSSQMGDLKYKATWSEGTLTVQGTRSTQRGDMPMKEQYSISADGKELTVLTTRQGPQGESVRKAVYDKK